MQLTNAFRQSEGGAALAVDPKLAATAEDFARFMARTNHYGHEADGRQASERAQAHGYAYCLVAENIAYQYRSMGFTSEALARILVEGWKRSPKHRRNMLDPSVADIGVAVAQSAGTQRWYAVQMFGLPQSAQMTFRVTNKAGASINYRVGDTSFELPPRVIRMHERCRPPAVTFDWPGQPSTTLEPRDGDRYVVVRTPTGLWQLTHE